MKLSYEALISGDIIFVEGVGNFRPPVVKDLKPTGIGLWTYNLYLNVLSWEKEDFLNQVRTVTKKEYKPLDNDKVTVFDAMTLLANWRELLRESMAFFIMEDIVWDDENGVFFTYDKNTKEKVGAIYKDNFEDVKDVILQLNYINVGESAKPISHTSKKSQELWEKAQKYLKDSASKKPKDKSYELGNIISKLCAAGIGYTLFNIYDLTIFQLYDQFFQYGYLRAMNLNEMAFSNHGGDKFEMEAWLKPIIKI